MTWHVLVAEDSRTQAAVVLADLEAAGYAVTLAGTGEEALEQLRARPFDLVLSDVVMPGMGGYALCRHIRDDPALAATPVVLLTSLSDPLELISALEAGADTFLRKPYDRDQLLSRSRGILERRARRDPADGDASELRVGGRRFTVTAGRQQILQMLVSTFEDLVGTNRDLQAREEELARAHSELRRQLRAVVLERERLRTVVASAPTPMLITDAQGTVTEASQPSAQLFGRSAAELVGARFPEVADLVDEHDRPAAARVAAAMERLRAGETVEYGGSFDTYVRRSDGTTTPVVVRSAPIQQEGEPYRGAVTVFREIGGLAYHDPVTRLANDSLFADRVALAASHQGGGRATAVLVVKLDRFDLVRQTLGHEASNGVLADAGARLGGLLRSDVVQAASRSASAGFLGGDELGLVLGGVAQEVDAVRVARLAIEAIGAAYDVGGIDATLSASVGVALDDEGGDAADVIRAAAAAAARAAGDGGGRVEVFEPGIGERAAERLRLEADLRRGLARGELVVHFQPEIHVTRGHVTGAEALVRWRHPERGLLAPVDFIPLAEETGLIVAVDRVVLAEACRQAAAWRRHLPGGDRMTMAVNLSARHLGTPDLAAFVAATLGDTGLDPAGLLLEITESAVAGDASAAAESLRALRALGVGIAIDDFGTGYSSLLYLRDFPLDVLKIDRVFVDGMRQRPEDAAIVAGTVQLGHALGLHVVAEGIESHEQVIDLRALGCDFGQGYLWSRAIPAEEFLVWCGEHGARSSDVDAPAAGPAPGRTAPGQATRSSRRPGP
jgi:PAS domain S-box-containing protein/diguanylate cyclase (GGDEF)-like protein